MMRAIGRFLAVFAGFIAFVLLMVGVIGPAIEAWAAFVESATGSQAAGNVAMAAPFAAFFGLLVAVTHE